MYDRDAAYRPSVDEAKSKQLAQHLVYLLTALDREVNPQIQEAANAYYGNPSQVKDYQDYLLELINGLDEFGMASHVWDGRKTGARALADWWMNYQNAQEAKKLKARKEKLEAQLVLHMKKAAEEFADGLSVEDRKVLFDNNTGKKDFTGMYFRLP